MSNPTPLAVASPEQVQKYWLDRCPECGGEVKMACKCTINERICINDHTWARRPNGEAYTPPPHGGSEK